MSNPMFCWISLTHCSHELTGNTKQNIFMSSARQLWTRCHASIYINALFHFKEKRLQRKKWAEKMGAYQHANIIHTISQEMQEKQHDYQKMHQFGDKQQRWQKHHHLNFWYLYVLYIKALCFIVFMIFQAIIFHISTLFQYFYPIFWISIY